MKIAYNPKTAAALTTAPANNDITFDLSGLSIYVKGIRFKGTDTTYSVFKKHGSSGGGYDGLVPVPDYNNDSKNRFLKEDGTWTDDYVTLTTVLYITGKKTISSLIDITNGDVNDDNSLYVRPVIYMDDSKSMIYSDTKANTIIRGSSIKFQLSNDSDSLLIDTNSLKSILPIISTLSITGTTLVSTTTDAAPLTVSSNILVSKLNADLLDGKHNGEVTAAYLQHKRLDSTTINNTAGTFAFSGSGEPFPGTDWVGLQVGDNVDKFQISTGPSSTLYHRNNDTGGTNTTDWSPWTQIARVTDNVASATKLQTARIIWGLPFDGTANINGSLYIGSKASSTLSWNTMVGICAAGTGIGGWMAEFGNGVNGILLGCRGNNNDVPSIGGVNRVNISIAPDGGNVGIGITAPATKLHVAGSIRIDLSASNPTTAGDLITFLETVWKANSQTYSLPVISAIVSNLTSNSYNGDIRVGSTTGTTWISAGESGATLSKTLPIYNTESVWITADADIKFYTGANNERTSSVYAAFINNNGVNTPRLFISTIATGTKPILVTSTTLCDNLNADFIDGFHISSIVGGNKGAYHGSLGTSYTADTYSSTFVNKAFAAFAERGSWAYANNGYISTDLGVNIPLAGTAIFLWGANDINKTLLFITPYDNYGVSNPALNEMIFYTSNGSGYTPAWTRVLTSRNYTSFVNNYYWANVKVSTLSSTTTTPRVKALYINSESAADGIGFSGGSWLNSIGTSVILRNGHLRFGEASWDWNLWAGLKYVHSSKTIYLGLADNNIFLADSVQSGGILRFPGVALVMVDGKVIIASANYNNLLVLKSTGNDSPENQAGIVFTSANDAGQDLRIRGERFDSFLAGYGLVISGGSKTKDSDPNMYLYNTGRYISKVATGTKPIDVVSTTLCNNLNADLLDGWHATGFTKFYLSPLSTNAQADSAKSWFVNTMPSGMSAIVYNVPGSEKTIIVGKSTGLHGHMLLLGYDDPYLRLLRYRSGSWLTADWEKIYAGYADIAGYATRLDGGAIAGWGTLTAANGYSGIAAYDWGDRGAFCWAGKGGQMSMLVDGFFYLNEGRYRVLDTSDIGDWHGMEAYIYDSTNGTRFYWYKVAHINAKTVTQCRLEIIIHDDFNYPKSGLYILSMSSYSGGNNYSYSINLQCLGTTGNLQVNAVVDTNGDVWIRAWDVRWTHTFKFRKLESVDNIIVYTSGWATTALSNSFNTKPSNSCNILQSGGAKLQFDWSGNLMLTTYYTNTNYLGTIISNANINATGNMYAAHFYENSDIRYKRVLNNLTASSRQLASLPLFDFEWIDGNILGTGTSALEVQKILPNIVDGEEKLTLDYGVLGTISGVVACREIEEIKPEIEVLKLRIKELENQLNKH